LGDQFCSSPKSSSARTTDQPSNFLSNNPTPCSQFFNPANPKARSNSSSATPQHGLAPQSTGSLRITQFQQLPQQKSLHVICKQVAKLAHPEHSGVCTHLNPWASWTKNLCSNSPGSMPKKSPGHHHSPCVLNSPNPAESP
jgi:hypothetical protein